QYTVDLSLDNNQLYLEWDYYPAFSVLEKQDLLKNIGVFLMLFVYISIICFTAVAVISYTRSITIALNNREMFRDLRLLGANEAYIKNVIRKQLSKLFLYPTVTGSAIMYVFYGLILFQNDGGSFSISEVMALGVDLIVLAVVGAFIYLIYRLSLRQVLNIISNKN
ncbi:MAG: ABC transporter permease, partial [Bacillota bacterium]|nr:ABC transporter permease [Bacillota bacterium]